MILLYFFQDISQNSLRVHYMHLPQAIHKLISINRRRFLWSSVFHARSADDEPAKCYNSISLSLITHVSCTYLRSYSSQSRMYGSISMYIYIFALNVCRFFNWFRIAITLLPLLITACILTTRQKMNRANRILSRYISRSPKKKYIISSNAKWPSAIISERQNPQIAYSRGASEPDLSGPLHTLTPGRFWSAWW